MSKHYNEYRPNPYPIGSKDANCWENEQRRKRNKRAAKRHERKQK